MARPRTISDEEILAAARECFLAHGPRCSLDRIGRSLGVSGQALIRRFRSKRQLMTRALLPDDLSDWSALTRVPLRDDVFDELVEIASRFEAVVARIFSGVEILRNAGFEREDLWENAGPSPPHAARKALQQWFRRQHAQGRLRAPHPDAAAHLLLGALQFNAFLARAGGGSTRRIALRRLLKTQWRGLEPPKTREAR